nr:uncharacterized protein C11orf65 homolog [Salvelinus alpinus]
MEKNTYNYAIETAPSSPPVEDMMELDGRQQRVYHRAARMIQRTWRRHVDTRVFQYFKNLVRFRNQGDPRLLLKNVNPREANILDAAAGVHIRFRLGGTTFPPSIYYTDLHPSTHVDMCATAPRTTPTQARSPSPGRYTGGPVRDDHAGWYHAKSFEEALCTLSVLVQAALLGDIITLETNGRKVVEFHHFQLQRRQDVDRRKKRRKIEWLNRSVPFTLTCPSACSTHPHLSFYLFLSPLPVLLPTVRRYDRGCLHARTEHSETATLVERSAQGMMDAVEQLGPNHIVEWEVDELLEWTNALNFDEYINDWRVVGTSNSSESWKDKRLVPSNREPCVEFSGLGQEDSQVDTYSSILHPLVSSLIKSEHSKANLFD